MKIHIALAAFATNLAISSAQEPPSSPAPPPAPVVDITKPWPSPTTVQGIEMPAPRAKKEVETVLAAVKPMSDEDKKRSFRIVLCAAE